MNPIELSTGQIEKLDVKIKSDEYLSSCDVLYELLMPFEHCGVVVCALDLQSEGRGFESHSMRTSLDKAFCPQFSLSTQV